MFFFFLRLGTAGAARVAAAARPWEITKRSEQQLCKDFQKKTDQNSYQENDWTPLSTVKTEKASKNLKLDEKTS